MLEASFLENSWVHAILKMPVVKWYAQAIEPFTCKELGICFSEEAFKSLIKEELVFLFAQSS